MVDSWRVSRDLALRLDELDAAAADLAVEERLDGVFHMGIRLTIPRLRPQIGDVLRRTAELERHQVVKFVVGEALTL